LSSKKEEKMEALEAIKTRRSVRSFTTKPVPNEIIEEIVDGARLAPSANNVQPWEFVVATEQTTREKIARATDYGKFIADAPVCIAVFCKDTKYYLEDGCAATENILIGACALGLSSCWVAGDKKAYAREIKRILEVPRPYKLVSLLALGYSNVKASAYGKRELDAVTHWEKFRNV
jgi:nitroreductase